MANFVVSTTVSEQYSLSGAFGLVTATGTVHSLSLPARVVMGGNSSLTVLGTILGNDVQGGASNATISVNATANDVLIGATGLIRNVAGDAIAIGTSATQTQIVNQGTLVGLTNAIDNNGVAAIPALRVINSGTMFSHTGSAIESLYSLTLTNSGTLSTLSISAAAIDMAGGLLSLTNTGTISGGGVTAISGANAIFRIRNEGLILNDVLMGNEADVFRGAEGRVIGRVAGQGGSDLILTGRGDDTITGDAGSDTLAAGAGDDSLSGGEGNDILIAGAGADTMVGGAGDDLADYRASQAGVEIDLTTGHAAGGDATGDVLSQIENLRGSALADVLSGNALDNMLTGGAGSDLLEGRAGRDVLIGDSGADTLNGGEGTADRVSYALSRGNVVVNLGTNFVTGGFATGDVILGIEGVEGSAFGDALTGSGDANQILGGGGADVITGGRGNDTLTGGLGPEGDVFVFASGDGTDTIIDFEFGRDVIDLIAFGLTDFSQVLEVADTSDDGKDLLLNFALSPLGLSGLIVLRGLGALDPGDLDQMVQILPPE